MSRDIYKALSIWYQIRAFWKRGLSGWIGNRVRAHAHKELARFLRKVLS